MQCFRMVHSPSMSTLPVKQSVCPLSERTQPSQSLPSMIPLFCLMILTCLRCRLASVVEPVLP